MTVHKIKEGETLSLIAQRDDTTVEALQQLNSQQIKDVNLIYAGNTLNIPSNSALESNEEVKIRKVISLPPADEQPIGAEQNLFPSNIITCEKDTTSKKYKDIAYFVEGNAFYLLDKCAFDYLENAEKIQQDRVKNKDKKDVMKSLSQARLLDGLLSAEITSFISDEDKPIYQDIEKWLDNKATHVSKSKSAYEAAAWVKYKETKRDDILKKAQKQAVSDGYVVDDGKLYSYREPKIKKAIKSYLKARERFLDNAELTPENQIEDLKTRLQALNKINIGGHYHVGNALAYNKLYLSKEVDNTNKQYEALVLSIEDLSKLGIATPELALAGTEGMQEGHKRYAHYFNYLKQAKKLEVELHKKLKLLLKATNSFALPPNQILLSEFNALKTLEKEALNIHLSAIKNVLDMSSSLFLLWNAEDYRPKPFKNIVKGDFPLREYILGSEKEGKGEFSQLRYISLNDISQPIERANNSISPQENSGHSIKRMLSDFVVELPIEDTWFDEDGLFNVAAFNETLKEKNIEVESLNTSSVKWGEAISNILFSKELTKRLSPFDDTKQAQYFRMAMLSSEVSVSNSSSIAIVNNISGSGNTKTIEVLPLEAKAELVLAKGEVNIIQMMTGKPFIKFPEVISTKDIEEKIPVSYFDKGQKKTIQFRCGAFQAQMYCKAWGFAGASMVLGGKIELGAGGFTVPDLYEINNGELSSRLIKLEMGLKAGVELGGIFLWYPPSGYPDFLIDKEKPAHQLIKGAFKFEKSVTAELPIRFRFVDKKLLIGFNLGPPAAKLSFEGEITPSMVGAWVWQFQRLLRQANYRRIDIVADDETFKELSNLSKAMLYSQLNIGLFLAKQKDVLDQIMTIFDESSAGLVAYTLINGDEKILAEWTRLLIPEALGPLLYTLVSAPESFKLKNVDTQMDLTILKEEALLMQQLALCKVINWLGNNEVMAREQQAAIRQMQEALERMNRDSSAPDLIEEKKLRYINNRDELLDFMNRDVVVDERKEYNYDNSNTLYKYTKNNKFNNEYNALTKKLYDEFKKEKSRLLAVSYEKGLNFNGYK